MSNILSERISQATKSYICSQCDKEISRGDIYHRINIKALNLHRQSLVLPIVVVKLHSQCYSPWKDKSGINKPTPNPPSFRRLDRDND